MVTAPEAMASSRVSCPGAIQAHAEKVEELLEAHRPNGVGTRRVERRRNCDSLPQLFRPAQVEVAPDARFGLIPELLQRISLQVSRRRVA